MADVKAQVTQIVVLAVEKSALKDHVVGDEFRAFVDAAYDTLTEGGRLRLQYVWEFFAGRDGFDPKVAACPVCWVKTLEPRLGLPVELPASLTHLRHSDVATNAAKFFVKRDEVDRLLGPDPGPTRGRLTSDPRASGESRALRMSGSPVVPDAGMLDLEPGAPPAEEPGAPPALPPEARASIARPAVYTPGLSAKDKRNAILSTLGIVATALVMLLTFKGSCAKSPEAVDTAALVSIPASSGKRLGKSAQFVLNDPAWMRGPLEARETALRESLIKLRASGVESMSLVDATGAPVASAVWTGTETQIRWIKRR